MATTDLTFAVTQEITLQAPVQNNGTVSFPYPRGETATSRAWVGSGCVLADGAGNIYTSGFSVAFGSSSITLATVGTNNVLGLPTFLPGTGFVLRELQDDAAPTAGTIVAGVTTAGGSTATTGDVRGTYTPNATPDGAKRFALICALLEPEFLGMAQA